MNKPQDDGFAVTLDAPGYYSLAAVLARAFDQASKGKGNERHANALPFDQQPMQATAGKFGVGFLLGQATKKAEESQGMPTDRAVAELLGAINYIAGAVIYLERVRPSLPVDGGLLIDASSDVAENRIEVPISRCPARSPAGALCLACAGFNECRNLMAIAHG